jgi:hypothetical protein
MLDKILYEVGSSDKLLITAVSFITCYVNRYDSLFLPLVRQFFFVPDQLNKFVDVKMQCHPT